MKIKETYDLHLYLGSVNEQTRKEFGHGDLIKTIGKFQDGREMMIPVRVSTVEFVSGSQYRERGWCVSTINYPKIDSSIEDLNSFMLELAEVLISVFKQKRICVSSYNKTMMIEGDF